MSKTLDYYAENKNVKKIRNLVTETGEVIDVNDDKYIVVRSDKFLSLKQQSIKYNELVKRATKWNVNLKVYCINNIELNYKLYIECVTVNETLYYAGYIKALYNLVEPLLSKEEKNYYSSKIINKI